MKLLIVCHRFIGDALLLTPLLKQIRQARPDWHITVRVSPAAQTLLEGCPYVDAWQTDSGKESFGNKVNQTKGFNSVVLLRNSLSDVLQCRLAGVRQVLGYDFQRLIGRWYQRWGLGLHAVIPYPQLKTTTHQVETLLKFLTPLGIEKTLPNPLELWLRSDEKESLQQRLSSAAMKDIAVFHFSAASQHKAIDPTKVLPALRYLQAEDLSVICTGTKADAPIYEALSQQLDEPLVNWAGHTSLREVAALLGKAKCLLSLDSAPLHMAAAVGTPSVVGIFGATNPVQWAPFNPSVRFKAVSLDLPCKPCWSKTCANTLCRDDITAQQVLQAVQTVYH